MENRHLKIFISLFLATATLFLFWQVQYHGFISFDDPLYVVDNPNVNKGLSLKNVSWSFSFFETGPNWIPLAWISHMVDCQLYGLNPRGHHFNNLLLHVINTLLLFLGLSRMTKTVWRSALVSALFAAHPLHVESVAWVSERKDVLSTFFLLLTLWFYTRYVESAKIRRYLVALIFYALGLMAKPMLVTLPFVLILLDYWPFGRFGFDAKNKNRIRKLLPVIGEKIPFFALSGAISLLTFLSQKDAGAVSSLAVFPLSLRIPNALFAYVKYLEKMLWPNQLAFFYPYAGELGWWWISGSFALLALMTCFAVRNFRSRPWFMVGWLWYLGTLFPVIGIVQVGLQSMADRYTYVPLVGLFIIVSWGFYELLKRFVRGRVIFAVGGTLVFIIFGICSWQQTKYWRDDVTLFTHALNVTAGNHAAHNNLGLALFSKGKSEEAASHFSEALRIRPQSLVYRTNMGAALAKQGKFDEAIRHLAWIVDHVPSYTGASYNLGLLYLKQGKFEKGVECFKRILRFEPESKEAYFQLGRIMAQTDRYDEANSYFSKALKIDPGFQDARINMKIISAKMKTNTRESRGLVSKTKPK